MRPFLAAGAIRAVLVSVFRAALPKRGGRRIGVKPARNVGTCFRQWMGCWVVLATGCGGLLRFGPPVPPGLERLRDAASSDSSGTPSNVAAAKADPATDEVAGGLRVQTEVLAPDDIWEDQLPALRERAANSTPEEFRRWLIQRSATLITDRIAESLLYQKATARLGEGADARVQGYVDGEIRKVVTEQYGGIQRRFEKALEQRGRTLDDVRSKLRRRAIVGAYLESDVQGRVAEPTRAELYALFERQREQMRRPGQRSMSLIDIRVSRFYPEALTSPTREQSDQAQEQARRAALAALEELRNGADFADVARRRSHGLHAADGGQWGWIARDAVRERFLPAVTALHELSAGEISDVVETPDGFFIVHCDQVQEANEPDFVTAQPTLHRQFLNERYNRAIGEEVARLRSKTELGEEKIAAFHRRVVESALSRLAQGDS